MSPTDTNDRKAFWQEHVAAWQASGLPRKVYCKQHDLRYSAFGYWVRKLRRSGYADPVSRTGGFVPVTLASSAVGVGGLVLALPNGVEIRGIEADNLGLVRQLLECL